MFRRSNEIVFSPGGRRRSRRPPAWSVWLLAGLLSGAGGLLYLQQAHLPPRLTAQASASLLAEAQRSQAGQAELAAALARDRQRLAALQAERDTLDRELAASRTALRSVQADLDTVVEALPADPRKGAVEVRAARFASSQGKLDYDLVLTRPRSEGQPTPGTLQLVVTGESPQRGASSVSLKPIALSLGRQQVVRGSVPLPEGFLPRQTTVQVLDRRDSRLLGMRVLLLR